MKDIIDKLSNLIYVIKQDTKAGLACWIEMNMPDTSKTDKEGTFTLLNGPCNINAFQKCIIANDDITDDVINTAIDKIIELGEKHANSYTNEEKIAVNINEITSDNDIETYKKIFASILAASNIILQSGRFGMATNIIVSEHVFDNYILKALEFAGGINDVDKKVNSCDAACNLAGLDVYVFDDTVMKDKNVIAVYLKKHDVPGLIGYTSHSQITLEALGFTPYTQYYTICLNED